METILCELDICKSQVQWKTFDGQSKTEDTLVLFGYQTSWSRRSLFYLQQPGLPVKKMAASLNELSSLRGLMQQIAVWSIYLSWRKWGKRVLSPDSIILLGEFSAHPGNDRYLEGHNWEERPTEALPDCLPSYGLSLRNIFGFFGAAGSGFHERRIWLPPLICAHWRQGYWIWIDHVQVLNYRHSCKNTPIKCCREI